MSTLIVTGSPHEMATPELEPLAFDFANYCEGADTPSLPTVTLTHSGTGVSVPSALSGDPEIDEKIVTQGVLGSELTGGESYWLTMTVTLAVGKKRTARLLIKCLF